MSQDNGSEVQALLKSKIAQLENTEGKVSVAQAKEMKQMITSIVNNNDITAEEKVKQLNNKYGVLLQDNVLVNLEKEKIMMQFNKVNTLKEKLEVLCRELQKQNKTIIDESKRIAEEEQNKRQELSVKFHETIEQITVKMEEQSEDRMKLLKENDTLREKLINFAEQYQIREKHFETQGKAKDLEIQLLEAKLKQQMEIATQETIRAKSYNEQITMLTNREKELSAQLAYYADKFEQFQDTLSKSNDIFTTFKQEMEKMSRTIKKSEKENSQLKLKCEQTDIALINFAEERNNYKKQIDLLQTQKKKLEEVCRVLQNERSKNNNNNNTNNSTHIETTINNSTNNQVETPK